MGKADRKRSIYLLRETGTDIFATEKRHVSSREIQESLGVGRGTLDTLVRRGVLDPPDVSSPAREKGKRPWRLLWDTDALLHKLSAQQQEVVEHSKSYTPDLVEEMNHARLCVEVTQLLSSLSDRDQLILRLSYGLGGEDEHTLDQVGQSLGISRERVRQLEARALKRLRDTLPEERGAFYHEVQEHKKETEARDDKERQERYREEKPRRIRINNVRSTAPPVTREQLLKELEPGLNALWALQMASSDGKKNRYILSGIATDGEGTFYRKTWAVAADSEEEAWDRGDAGEAVLLEETKHLSPLPFPAKIERLRHWIEEITEEE